MWPSAGLPVAMLAVRSVDPMIRGKNLKRPARMEGIQAQNTAVVVSRVDQNVVGMLSHVGSAVKPNVRRLSRRTIEVMTTLQWGQYYQQKKIIKCTRKDW
jgi:hypothetical protein